MWLLGEFSVLTPSTSIMLPGQGGKEERKMGTLNFRQQIIRPANLFSPWWIRILRLRPKTKLTQSCCDFFGSKANATVKQAAGIVAMGRKGKREKKSLWFSIRNLITMMIKILIIILVFLLNLRLCFARMTTMENEIAENFLIALSSFLPSAPWRRTQ